RDGKRAFASLMMIRDGKVLGQEHFVLTLEQAAQTSIEEIVRRLIVTHYELATFIPKQLIVPTKLTDQDLLKQLLSQRAASLGISHKPQIVTPRAGLNKRLVSMAEENAQEYRSRKTHEWESRSLNLGAALNKLAAAVGLVDQDGQLMPPGRVEIYDISNIQGTSAVGSMVVFEQGQPAKQEYRRFKIASLKEQPNDVGMLREVLRRRLKRLPELVLPASTAQAEPDGTTSDDHKQKANWPRPDLIIVDGGKPQLGGALQILQELDLDIPVVGLAKRFEELVTPTRTVRFAEGSGALHLVQRMRDEAHRFAITFHRETRGKRNQKSLLDEIVGIGPARKKLLIQKYGSLSGIADASETELAKIIGAKAAQALSEQLR
ncbi:MAG: helix-hairpin-helix domain-containing protein, partial [bacterium]|nr:helix-hairpin-helix domain-containing protein [bacterium]